MTHKTVREWERITVGDDGFTRSQANTLLAAARTHRYGGRDGTNILCDHHRFLRAQQMVGVIAGERCSLEILPKVDPHQPPEDEQTVRRQLVHMLDVSLGLNLSIGGVNAMARQAQSLLEIFIAAFADRLLCEMRRGLPRQYLEQENDLKALRGQLDVVRQFTVNTVRPDRLACRFDELDSNIPLMQVMKACVVKIEKYARVYATRRKLTELRLRTADVSDIHPGALPWKSIRIDRSNMRWRQLVELARLLLGQQWQDTRASANDPDGMTLLFPMNDLFERYIAVQLRRALAGTDLEVVVQGGRRYCLGSWDYNSDCIGNSHSTRPDILVTRKGKVIMVIDTKWKRYGDGVAQADAYQMMAYARLYKCNHLALLYPADAGDMAPISKTWGIAGGVERLDTIAVPLSGSGLTVRDALASTVGRSINSITHSMRSPMPHMQRR